MSWGRGVSNLWLTSSPGDSDPHSSLKSIAYHTGLPRWLRIINLKEFEPTCQSTLEKLFRTSAVLPGNFPEKIQLLGQQIFRDILFHKK